MFRFLSALIASAVIFLPQVTQAGTAAVPELTSDLEIATAGYYRLQWQISEPGSIKETQFILQESLDSHFEDARTLYQGPDLATVLSGRADGVRYYRVRAFLDNQPPGRWSNSVRVETRHHTLARALVFFAVGAVVFVLTLILVLRGNDDESHIQVVHD